VLVSQEGFGFEELVGWLVCLFVDTAVSWDATKNSVAFSPQANYTERPPLVGEVSANFCG
jgi:hypothetical protein